MLQIFIYFDWCKDKDDTALSNNNTAIVVNPLLAADFNFQIISAQNFGTVYINRVWKR
jgi:hypothetical protein